MAAEFAPEHFEMGGVWVQKERCRQDLGADVSWASGTNFGPELLILNFNRVLCNLFILFI